MKTVIFDFDGTIVDNLTAGIAAYNHIATQKGYVQITNENREHLRGLTSMEVLRELQVSIFDLPRVVLALRHAIHDSVSTWQLHGDIADVLRMLKNRGYALVILTSNSGENVNRFLQEKTLNIFDAIHTGTSVFGKARLLKQIFIDLKIDPADAAYVGDEIRDIVASRKAGCIIVSVAWGLNTTAALEKTKPDFLARKPGDLLQIFY